MLAIALAAGIAVALLLDVLADDPPQLPDPGLVLAAGVAIALAVSLAWRRRWPLAALALAIAPAVPAAEAPMDAPVPVVLALVVATYSVGAHTNGRAAILGAGGVLALVAIAGARDLGPDSELNDLAVPLLVLGGPWLAGL